MISKEQAIGVARNYLETHSVPKDGFVWLLPLLPQQHESGWYFPFRFVRADGNSVGYGEAAQIVNLLEGSGLMVDSKLGDVSVVNLI